MAFSINAFAIYVEKMPYSITQPDGTKIDCFITGDEFGGMIHDQNGYSLLKNEKDGWWYYAETINDKVVCSKYVVGKINPVEKELKKGVHSFDKEFYEKVTKHRKENIGKFSVSGGILKSASTISSGTIQTLVIFVRFKGMNEFYNNRDYYSPYFNSTTGQSLKNYFNEASYNQLDINSTFYPICASNTNLSYLDTYDKSYYMKNGTNGYGESFPERMVREHSLIKRAVEAIASQVPTDLNLDANNDGNIDHVCILAQGGLGVITDDILWPHEWSLYSQNVFINGKKVNEYTFLNYTDNSMQKTICHEFFHVLGATDFYHGPDNSPNYFPASYWGIMGDGHSNIFPHMDAYSKNRYGGWITSIPEITQPGTYTLSPLTSSSNNCYKIKSQYSPDEYFVVEYRKRSGIYENTLGGDGLLVYRIYENGDNYYGPNDEAYIYRPNGTLTVDGNPQSANYSSSVGRTSINDTTNPTSFLKNGTTGGLRISNIGTSGTTISFSVDFNVTISGPSSLTCPSGATFSANLPAGATVSWACTSTNGNLTINPTTGYAYATNTVGGNGIITATMHIGGGDVTLPTKTIWVGVPPQPGAISIDMDAPPSRFTASISGVPEATSYNWYKDGVMNSTYHGCLAIFNRVDPYCGTEYDVQVEAVNSCGVSAKTFLPVFEPDCFYRLLLSPNPTTTESTVELVSVSGTAFDLSTEWELEVYDQSQMLKTKKTKLKGQSCKINTTGWTDGVYIVRATYKERVLAEKLIVKH